LAADPKEAREPWRLQACGLNWCNPAFADGNLVLPDSRREIICLKLF
jgi:hypothetical protein